MLEEAGVGNQLITELAKFCTTAPMFAHMATTEAEMVLFLTAACNLDVQARPTDFGPRCRLMMVWDSCKKRLSLIHI